LYCISFLFALAMDWENLPDAVLLMVLCKLSVASVISVSSTCRRWSDISKDNLLWKHLFLRDWRLPRNTSLREKAESWREEYVRLVETPPTECVQTITTHKDEVLHVSYSNDGKNFVSCSKDGWVSVWWNSEKGEVSLAFKHDMKMYGWKYTWASKYNPSDSMLLVAGVVSEIKGEIAIFDTKKGEGDGKQVVNYDLLCRIQNNPYDVQGAWCSETHFLCGRLTGNPYVLLDASVWVCEVDKDEDYDTNILSPSLYRNQLLTFRDEGTNYVRCLVVSSRTKFNNDAMFLDYKDLVKQQPPQEFIQQTPDHKCANIFRDNQIYLIFLSQGETSAPHQIGFKKVYKEDLENSPVVEKPDRVLDMKGHIVGLALSPDSEKLYVNVRSWPENVVLDKEEAPPIANDIEMRVIHLSDLRVEDRVMRGHVGYTDSKEAFYIYLDVGDKLVGSGSEDGVGRVWDRSYGCLVGKANHQKCVNSAVFNPRNQEIMVTGSDDHTIKIWRSKRTARMMNKPKTFG